MRASHLLLFATLSAVWTISLLHGKLHQTVAVHSQFFSDLFEVEGQPRQAAPASAAPPGASSLPDPETVLVIAAVPYTAEHAMALWTHLECITGGIDRVLVSAPDTPWSREVVAAVLERFQRSRRPDAGAFELEATFYTNDRYDVGLWCDGLTHRLGIDGRDLGAAATPRPVVFLINDSSVAIRRYDTLTRKVVEAARVERRRRGPDDEVRGGRGNLKLASLNGNLVQPGGETKNYWVESVYRGLTPDAVSTFYRHSCTAEAGRACAGQTGNGRKQCIVNRYEMSLADSFSPFEVDAMYPTYLPKEWDASAWEKSGGRIGPVDQWIRGRRYFRYLVQEHDFPFRKLKWPVGQPAPPKSRCLELLDGSPSRLDDLPYPTAEAFEAFQAKMLKSESTL